MIVEIGWVDHEIIVKYVFPLYDQFQLHRIMDWSVRNPMNNYVSINPNLMKIELWVVSDLLNNFILTKMVKICFEVTNSWLKCCYYAVIFHYQKINKYKKLALDFKIKIIYSKIKCLMLKAKNAKRKEL